ncbi:MULTISPECIES: IS1 family transposase [unclassified Acinetobacter]|uniref:IS1 family transposase n=1 Tax=unclassified Acinetobacter TaxID=196816 RepID=UPI001C24B53D
MELCKTRRHTVWTWIALCRRTRQVIAYVCGQRNDKTCTDLRCRIPSDYFNLATCSDYWSSYAEVLDPKTHRSVGKHRGLTNHVEQFNATLRNRLGRFTRKTLSFSKKKENHEAILPMFLLKYNLDMKDKWIACQI